MTHLLWRIDGTSQEPKREEWQQGATLHLLFQSLTTIIARRDGLTRTYLVLEGCPHCRPDGCDRVCHRVLFEQLVRTTLPGVELVQTRRLVASASERRHVVAVPFRPNAQLLDSAFLGQWSEGRLVTTWSRLRATPQPITVGALLAVSADGPPPTRALKAAGWRCLPLASILARRALRAETPQPVRVGVRAGEALLQAVRDPHLLNGSTPGNQAVTSFGIQPGVETVVVGVEPGDDARLEADARIAAPAGEA
jgi:hypothetical protein